MVANVPPDDPFVEMMTFLTFDNNPLSDVNMLTCVDILGYFKFVHIQQSVNSYT